MTPHHVCQSGISNKHSPYLCSLQFTGTDAVTMTTTVAFWWEERGGVPWSVAVMMRVYFRGMRGERATVTVPNIADMLKKPSSFPLKMENEMTPSGPWSGSLARGSVIKLPTGATSLRGTTYLRRKQRL